MTTDLWLDSDMNTNHLDEQIHNTRLLLQNASRSNNARSVFRLLAELDRLLAEKYRLLAS